MLKDTAQLFDALVHFVTQQGYGEVYTRDPRQEVPPDCGFVRFRTPGGVLFTSAGLVKFCTREEGVAGGGGMGVGWGEGFGSGVWGAPRHDREVDSRTIGGPGPRAVVAVGASHRSAGRG